jgi:pimeloyl-ACP methyl ester carboxylesterase
MDARSYTHLTAPTQYVEANGTRFAYRRFGNPKGVPLLFVAHLMANMDDWDPAIIDGLARGREVILFDNTGVGGSTGETPNTFAQMAVDALAFADALGLSTIDVLGFSIGSMVAQEIALQAPELVRRLVLVGSGPRNGDHIPLTAQSEVIFSATYANPDDMWLDALFSSSPASRAAGHAYFARRDARVVNRDVPVDPRVQQAQFAAFFEWGQPSPKYGQRFEYLQDIRMPVLVVNGKADIIVDPENSMVLTQLLPNAQLILYPDSAHGSLFQYPQLFVEHTAIFLHGEAL